VTEAHLDLETRSVVDLNKCGVEVYAEHESTEILSACFAFDGGPVTRWHKNSFALSGTHAAIEPLFRHVEQGGIVWAHNARFEFYLWNMAAKRYGWPAIRVEQMRCTMAAGRALSLPGSLGQLAQALRLPIAKDDDGRRLMLKMCKPRKPRKNEPQDAIIWHETPEDIERLTAYCATDVEVERAIHKTLIQLSPSEQDLWVIDQHINSRGVYVDLPAVLNLIDLSEREKSRLQFELRRLTNGRVRTPGSKEFAVWLAERGCELPDMRKGTVAAAMARDNAPDVARALEIRAEHSKASTAKLKAMAKGVSQDGRARGLLEYHGAGTGRWAGRRIQTQNMPRTPEDFEVEDAENIISWARIPGGEQGIAAEYGKALDGVSWTLRSLLMAAPGNELLCADYSNIEGRVLAWLAGEQWKIEAFEAYDAKTGHDLYKLAYAASFGVPPDEVTKPQRQIGKVQELALGYQGGHGAFLSMGANYGVKLDEIASAVRDAVPGDVWDTAVAKYWGGVRDKADEILADARAAIALGEDLDEDEFLAVELGVEDYAALLARKAKFDLPADQWAAIRIIVDGWRAAHPNVVQFWRDLERAAVDAVREPGTVTSAGPIRYRKSGDFLYCRLPSGRSLSYPYARIVYEPNKWDIENAKTAAEIRDLKKVPKVRFEGIDGKTKRWCTQTLYGGLSSENVTQATARDILADAIKRLERAGLPVIMHVHDEIVSEVPKHVAETRYPEFLRLMAAKEPWANGLPVTVEGWKNSRYKK